MNKTMGTVGSNINPTLQSMVNNDFMKDPNFIRYQNQFTENMNDLYDTSVLSNLANRGLMRSSGLQGATNAFNDTLAKNQLNLYDNYYSRLNNNLSNLRLLDRKEHCKNDVIRNKDITAICAYCGKEFVGTIDTKFCSNACKSAYRRKSGAFQGSGHTLSGLSPCAGTKP
jgi:hypothetical protein